MGVDTSPLPLAEEAAKEAERAAKAAAEIAKYELDKDLIVSAAEQTTTASRTINGKSSAWG